MAINTSRVRQYLNDFNFRELFIEELGWSLPPGNAVVPFSCGDAAFTRRPIAQLGGVVVFEIAADDGAIPDKETCAAVHREITERRGSVPNLKTPRCSNVVVRRSWPM